ncbi:CDP-diacylglycerol--glycerol-3-phosphate 3-phosphatidyltransferase [Helicobacter cappadocius]|uniref:CDP-diacylglycerol--glycerol-3-phosphate 3-phosphatidyltransferase n=1 Tax=Helicobacter cappadocius TaxID=3063998 RepID=A0AA90PUV0_9HELI|nr:MULTISPECIES: CDP-diacylglycerol--glycerol-3-phosphate 3-phosphatidyltransferase [unclassified Helicobacter]MDO7252901.1 CDP-diacylglycerol--glycerol-3-phosphate 3-phosphatidyltransferase [Helicobacter sp. faydin-H75]MDP2538945.1 CDP-diacylglycerol--glycerol-3-phosphate 3-phosphatidyltransferase [Helicobacter sp. faydin-H76]
MKNLPNILTISRIFLSIFLLIFILYGDALLPTWADKSWINYFSCLIFCLASLTDFFDGYIARNYNSKSTFGEVFDPLADKMLILSAFVGLLVAHRANAWAVYIILSREFFITGLRVIVASSGKKVAANMLGKYKTGFQILAIAFLLADFFPGGEILLWIATFATLYSGGDYAIRYYKSMK